MNPVKDEVAAVFAFNSDGSNGENTAVRFANPTTGRSVPGQEKILRARIVLIQLAKRRQSMWKEEAAKSGVTFGSALAIAISWSANQSILWAILHGIFSWFYVIYFALTR